MNLIQATFKAALPSKRKMTPSGWESFNAPCCHHRGEKRDNRKRGGVIFNGDGFSYHCFNCNFKAGWTPGHTLSKNSQTLMSWLGVSDDDIKRLTLEAIKKKNDFEPVKKILNFDLELKKLPLGSKTVEQWALDGCIEPEFIAVVEYILQRGMELEWYPWMWSDENGYRDRIIIPYYHENKIVGWTARKITDGKPKYLTSAQPSYVFNIDRQTDDRQYVIVVEGPMDAIPVDGVAVMSNELNETQITRINNLGKEVILVPDNDRAGAKLLSTAIEQNWSVSLPEWGDDVKDVADAVRNYGRVYTLFTILKYRINGQIKLTMLKRKIENAAEKYST